ncbi:hypothetical protein ZIOFF_012317 [Zingiber officinale]|uniref:aldehyde oxygenase (deformylating) n=1 Tax=Zingiber officinale TaxID=94328 RepID=A0A8J5HPX6_ZINOF|nr:hypothetical protein ZIOFF_012317 [Zingiber officinale]
MKGRQRSEIILCELYEESYERKRAKQEAGVTGWGLFLVCCLDSLFEFRLRTFRRSDSERNPRSVDLSRRSSAPLRSDPSWRLSSNRAGWSVIVSQIIFYFILEDFVFYWGHRILHTKWLYKHVHSVHHEHATPFGLTSEYAHPAEILFLGFATILGPALTGPHLFTLWLWMIVRVIETVEAHSGYDFPWSPSNFLPLYGGAEFHDYHHRVLYTKSGNYASTFVYMDWLFGTDRDYRKMKALEEEGRKY